MEFTAQQLEDLRGNENIKNFNVTKSKYYDSGVVVAESFEATPYLHFFNGSDEPVNSIVYDQWEVPIVNHRQLSKGDDGLVDAKTFQVKLRTASKDVADTYNGTPWSIEKGISQKLVAYAV